MKTTEKERHYEGADLESMAEAKNYYQWMTEEFKPFIKGTVVEVGAGVGTFTEHLADLKPKQLYAFEPTEEMGPKLAQNMKRRKNVVVVQDYLKSQLKQLKGKADVVIYINVLEHVERDDEELKTVFEVLKPGGSLLIYVPALQGLYGSFDEQVGHYRRYSKAEMRAKLEAAGFSVEQLYYSDIYGMLPWFVNFRILKQRRLNQTSIRIYDRFAIPVIKFQEKLFKPPVGKNLWAIAKKPE